MIVSLCVRCDSLMEIYFFITLIVHYAGRSLIFRTVLSARATTQLDSPLAARTGGTDDRFFSSSVTCLHSMLVPACWRSLAKYLTYGVIRSGLYGPFRQSRGSAIKCKVMMDNATVEDVGEEGARPRREDSSNDVGGETTAMTGCDSKYKVCRRYEHASLILSV